MSRLTQKDAPRGASRFETAALPAGPALPAGRMRRLNLSANTVTAMRALWEETEPDAQAAIVRALGGMDDEAFTAWTAQFDVPAGTAADVTSWVDGADDPVSAAEAALAVESEAETPRKTLVAALEARIKAAGDQ